MVVAREGSQVHHRELVYAVQELAVLWGVAHEVLSSEATQSYTHQTCKKHSDRHVQVRCELYSVVMWTGRIALWCCGTYQAAWEYWEVVVHAAEAIDVAWSSRLRISSAVRIKHMQQHP